MALIDDIEFYGRAADAGELPRDEAARLLAEASGGGLTLRGADTCLDNWATTRADLQAGAADTLDALRAVRNGKPVPEHVLRNQRQRERRQRP